MKDFPRNRRDESGVRSTLPAFRRAVHCLLAAVLPAACLKQLPPAPTPEAVVPPISAGGPPAAGHGRLIVDVVDGPTPVQRVAIGSKPIDNGRGRVSYALYEAPHLLCPASPCVTDVPAGNIVLGFPVRGNNDVEVELVHVGPEPSVYRRSLSLYEDRTGKLRTFGILGTSIGGTSALAGIVFLPVGLAGDHPSLTIAGGITMGVGAALIALGVWAIRADSPTYRPGSSNHFPLAPAAP